MMPILSSSGPNIARKRQLLIFAALVVCFWGFVSVFLPEDKSRVMPEKVVGEAGWFTIAEKPVLNEKAQMWEIVVYPSRKEGVGAPKQLTFYSSYADVKGSHLDKGDKVYLVYPEVGGTTVMLVNRVLFRYEYDRLMSSPN